MKILLAAPLPPPEYGGIVNWSKIICRELSKKPGLALSFVDTNVRYRSLTNYSIPHRLVGGSAQALRDTYRAFCRMRRDRPDLFHLCSIGGLATPKDILMLRIARFFKIPSVIHYRVGHLPAAANRNGINWKITKLALSLADAVVLLDTQSQLVVRKALPSCFTAILPNMVNLEEIDKHRQNCCVNAKDLYDRRKIVFMGHILPQKGVRELVEACMRMDTKKLSLELFGPSEADFREEIEAMARSNSHGEWLQLHGTVPHDEAIRQIMSSDIFVLPSYSEGFPNVILEAMACGKAIVSTRVGAVPEMLNIGGDRECGICVHPRDSESIAAALSELLENPDKRQELGLAARQRVEERYAASLVCSQLVDFWRTVAQC